MPVLSDADLTFLNTQRIARLATTDSRGQPHLVPVCFAHLDGRLYVPIDAKPKRGNPRRLQRLRNLRERPEAALLLDHYDDDWTQLQWLLIRARATILESPTAGGDDAPDERTAALAVLEARYPQYAAMGLSQLGLPVIALTPAAVSRWRGAASD